VLGLVAAHLAFCADDKHVEDLATHGHIDHHVRSAVALGVPPAIAIRMAAYNAAAHFRVDHLIGSITPNRLADLQLLPDLTTFRPVSVWVDGIEVARDGAALFDNTDPIPPETRDTIRLAPTAHAQVPAPDAHDGTTPDHVWVQAMEMYDGYYKRAFHVQLPVLGGAVVPDPTIDVAKIAIVDRHHATGTTGVGFVRGFGLTRGAIAASTNCDNQNIVVVATTDTDLHHALTVCGEIGGGYVAVADGEVLATVPLPVAGIMSDQPWEVVHEQSVVINRVASDLGCRIHAPFMILAFVGLNGVPDLALSEAGLTDVATEQPLPVVLDTDQRGVPICRCAASTAWMRS